jgi:putative peptidoglycan lipid II flippase
MEPSVARPARLIGFCTLLSRILGLLREILCARFFGAGFVWDCFLIAFLIPNLFRRIFGEGALTAAFIPTFVNRIQSLGLKEAFRTFNRTLWLLTIVLLGFVGTGLLISYLLPALLPGIKLGLVCELLRIMLPYLWLICLVAVMGAALNSMGHFTAPAIAPVLLNVLLIGAIIFFAPLMGTIRQDQIFVLAWAVLLGGCIQLAIQLPPLLSKGWRPYPKIDPGHQDIKEIRRLLAPVVVGLAMYQINELVDLLIAELCVPGHGAVSALGYANRLVQLPLSIIGTALATASFPLLTSKFVISDRLEFTRLLAKTIRLCVYLAIPATMGALLFAKPIVRLIFERGAFTPEDTIRVARVLVFYALGIWCYSCNLILARAFYAQKDTLTPTRISMIMVGLNFLLNLVLVWPLKEAGLALSTSITGFLTFMVLSLSLARRFPALDLRSIRQTIGKTLLASVLMCLGAFVMFTAIKVPGVDILVAIVVGIVIYIPISRILKLPEVYEIFGRGYK